MIEPFNFDTCTYEVLEYFPQPDQVYKYFPNQTVMDCYETVLRHSDSNIAFVSVLQILVEFLDTRLAIYPAIFYNDNTKQLNAYFYHAEQYLSRELVFRWN